MREVDAARSAAGGSARCTSTTRRRRSAPTATATRTSARASSARAAAPRSSPRPRSQRCPACSRRPGEDSRRPGARGSRAGAAARSCASAGLKRPARASRSARAAARRLSARSGGRGRRHRRRARCSSSARSVGVCCTRKASPRRSRRVPRARVDVEHHLGGPGEVLDHVLEVVDRAPPRAQSADTLQVHAAWRQRAAVAAAASACARARSISSCGAKGSTVCTTRHVLPASLWSTRPFTSTTSSTASAASCSASALPNTSSSTDPVEVVEGREHHVVAVARADPLGLGDDAADRHPVLVAALGERRERAVDARAQRLAQRLERVRGDEQADRFLLDRQQLGLVELLRRDRRVHRTRKAVPRTGPLPRRRGAGASPPAPSPREVEDRALADQRVLLDLLAGCLRLLEHVEHAPCGSRRSSRTRRT